VFTSTLTTTLLIKSKMSSQIQREYLLNARKAIRIANDLRFNNVAYNTHVAWAESYWVNYLKSVGAKRFRERVSHLMELLAAKNTRGALKYIDM
jgi:hypothetical protein